MQITLEPRLLRSFNSIPAICSLAVIHKTKLRLS